MFEVEQSSDLRNDPALRHYLQTIARYPLLEKGEEARLARKARKGDKVALDRLVNSNLRFVVSVAKGFQGRGLSLMDLIAEGNVGLITAAKRFDDRRDFRFVTYAVWWIRQAIQTALQDHTRTVRLPANRVRQIPHLVQTERRLEQEKMGPVDMDSLAEAMETSPDKVVRLKGAVTPNLGLDTPIGDNESTLADTLADENAELPADALGRRQLNRDLEEAMLCLDSREKLILEQYFGLNRQAEASLETIGQSLNLSRERVRQIRNRAFAKLRKCLRGEALAEHVG
jgi:RNA polymerase primary sigma factor